jgi:predicted nuclease of restriction endonuclease-like RecB superfamily
VQGGYELAFIKYLDENQISFRTHPGFIAYRTDESEKVKRYHPDFYLNDIDTYVDIKCSWTREKDASKLELVKKYNPNIKLLIIAEPEMHELGIDLHYKTLLQLRNKYPAKG